MAPGETDCPLSTKQAVRETALLTLSGRSAVKFAAMQNRALFSTMW
jgi:hypothetical protein